MLPEDQLEAYLAPLTPEQAENIRVLRAEIQAQNLDLQEQIDTGKWFRGLLTYQTQDGIFAYALGPLSAGYTTFHMMPFYGSPTLQAAHTPALKKLLSGKSCIKFKSHTELPLPTLQAILATTPTYATLAKEMLEKRKKKP